MARTPQSTQRQMYREVALALGSPIIHEGIQHVAKAQAYFKRHGLTLSCYKDSRWALSAIRGHSQGTFFAEMPVSLADWMDAPWECIKQFRAIYA